MKTLWPMICGRSKVLWNPEHHQDVIICFLAHCEKFLRIILKSVSNFLSYFENSQDRQTSKSCLSLDLLGGGNYVNIIRKPGTVKISFVCHNDNLVLCLFQRKWPTSLCLALRCLGSCGRSFMKTKSSISQTFMFSSSWEHRYEQKRGVWSVVTEL